MVEPSSPFPKRPSRDPDVADDFSGPALRPDLWVPEYLPHWTTPERSRARYDLSEGSGVRLLIEQDQPDWRPEDAPLRVSNLQTGTFSGPPGSQQGTHRHRPDGLSVRTETPERLLWAPSSGRLEITVSASSNPNCMLAAWLVGLENASPLDSGEICLFEIDSSALSSTETRVRCGLKAHGDPRLVSDMVEVAVPFDASRPHTWAVEWGASGVTIGCEGVVVFRSLQRLDYPLILMLDLFELGPRDPHDAAYPKSAVVHSVRGWTGVGEG